MLRFNYAMSLISRCISETSIMSRMNYFMSLISQCISEKASFFCQTRQVGVVPPPGQLREVKNKGGICWNLQVRDLAASAMGAARTLSSLRQLVRARTCGPWMDPGRR